MRHFSVTLTLVEKVVTCSCLCTLSRVKLIQVTADLPCFSSEAQYGITSSSCSITTNFWLA